MKEISSKSKKTDADHEELARLEFMGSLYMTKDGPVIPADNITAHVIDCAKKERRGPAAKSGVFTVKHAILEYDGPRTAEGLWTEERFRFQKLVRVKGSRVLRTRPIFEEWSCVIELEYENTIVSEKELDRWLEIGGIQVGMCDWRPRYGRYVAEVVEPEIEDVELSKDGQVIIPVR